MTIGKGALRSRKTGWRLPERALDALPGALTWTALLVTALGAWHAPKWTLAAAALLAAYIALRFALAGIANIIGLRRIRRWEGSDWADYYRREAGPDALAWEAVHHLLIIPNDNEPEAVLRRTLDNLAGQYQAAARLTVVLAMEAAEAGSAEKAKRLCEDYQACFADLFYTVHPQGLPGEWRCKSANLAWAARRAAHRLINERGLDSDHILVTLMDADTLWHRDHFYALTALFALDSERYARFWQAPIRYHSHIWRVNPLLRPLHTYSAAFELAYLAAPWWRPLPMSSYALSLRLLAGCGFPDTAVIADEWRLYLKAFFARRGRVTVERVFLPFHANATTGATLRQALRNRYRQTLRHAWGSREIGYTLASLLHNHETPLRGSLRLLLRVSHDLALAGAGWAVVTLGSQMPLLLHPGLRRELLNEGFGSPAFVLLQAAFLIISLLGIVFWVQDVRLRPPRPRPVTRSERLLTLISFPLLPLLSFLFVALPVIHAQTRLMAGKRLTFEVTEKG